MSVSVGYNHMQAAQALLARLAFAGHDLAAWRVAQGISETDLERLVRESADDTVEEVQEMMEQTGEFSIEQFRDFLMREGMTMFQVGWVCALRAQRRAEGAET